MSLSSLHPCIPILFTYVPDSDTNIISAINQLRYKKYNIANKQKTWDSERFKLYSCNFCDDSVLSPRYHVGDVTRYNVGVFKTVTWTSRTVELICYTVCCSVLYVEGVQLKYCIKTFALPFLRNRRLRSHSNNCQLQPEKNNKHDICCKPSS